MTLSDFEELSPDREVLRFSKDRADYISAETELPTWQSFNPSTEEKADAPVRISVWDTSRTTLDQARQLSRKAADPVFALPVRAVAELSGQTGVAMSVRYDPLSNPAALEAGAGGHAGLFGVERAKDEDRVAWKDRLDALGGAATWVR